MAERKPPDVSWRSWVDRQIYDAERRGAFDNLAGSGKPLADLDAPYDELWWVKKKLRDEGVSFLPPSLAVRRELEITREAIAASDDEEHVRDLVRRINERIRHVNRTSISGPPTTVMPLDVEEVVERWRSGRESRSV